jgi:hypothetical protein
MPKPKPKAVSPGAALVQVRWAKTTAEQRHELSIALNNARWGPLRAKRKAQVARDRLTAALERLKSETEA